MVRQTPPNGNKKKRNMKGNFRFQCGYIRKVMWLNESHRLRSSNDLIIDSSASVNIIEKEQWGQLNTIYLKCYSERGGTNSMQPLDFFDNTWWENFKISLYEEDDSVKIHTSVLNVKGQAMLRANTTSALNILKVGGYALKNSIYIFLT